MLNKDTGTEDLIKETAKRIFFAEGKFKATTQEIADAAGVNRTLVHYYFRSKEVLFEKILVEGQIEFRKKMSEHVDNELPLKEKISKLIDIWMKRSMEYPFLDAYLMSQIGSLEKMDNYFKNTKEEKTELEGFLKEIESAMNSGEITKYPPIHFVFNLMSLIAHPISMVPLLKRGLNMNNKEFNNLMSERRDVILKVLFIK